MSKNEANTIVGGKGSFSFSSSYGSKYGSLLKKPTIKSINKDIAFLFDYIYSVAPSFSCFHTLTTIIRLMQLIGPSFACGYRDLWLDDKESSKMVMSYLSIIFHLIPVEFREIGGLYYCIIYLVLLFLILLATIFTAKSYQKNASVHVFVPPIFAFFYATLGYFIHPIAYQLIFAQISKIGFLKESNVSIGASLIIIIIVLILSLIYSYQFFFLISQTLTFREDSLKTLCPITQSAIFFMTLLITLITAFAEQSDRYTQGFFLIIAAALYLVTMYVSYLCGGILSRHQSTAFSATCITGACMCIANAITCFMTKSASLLYVVLFIIAWIIIYIIINYYSQKRRIRSIYLMDEIIDENGLFNQKVNSKNAFMTLAVIGFDVAHPFCINWTIFKLAVDKWPKNGRVWYVYAKFISVYPECTQTLGWIYHMIQIDKIKSVEAKTIKTNSISIARQRETNLSTDLKMKLTRAMKKVTSTKHKLRHVWDLAIQGNVNDMETATRRAIREIDHTDSEMKHILRQFPNNRFVTRSYARFCRELMADNSKSLTFLEKTRLLQRGIMVNKDQSHEEGIKTFRNLPDKLSNAPRENPTISAFDGSTISINDLESEEELNSEQDESALILNRINHLSIPSVRYSIALSLSCFIILFFVPTLIVFVVTKQYVNTLTKPLEHMHNIAELRTNMYHLETISIRRIMEKLDLKKELEIPVNATPPQSIGGDWEIVNMLAFMINKIGTTLQNLETFRATDFVDENIEKAKRLLFNADIPFMFFSAVSSIPTLKKITLQSAISDFMLQQSNLVKGSVQPITNAIWKGSVVLDVIVNIEIIQERLDESMNLLIEYIDNNMKKNNVVYNIVMYFLIVLLPIIYIAMVVIQILWMNKNKEKIYSCLTALPKNAVSVVAENLRVLKKETDNSSLSTQNTEVNKQEDNILKTFFSGGSGTSIKALDISIISISTIVGLTMHVVTVVFLAMLASELGVNLRRNCPHINNSQGSCAMLFSSQMSIFIMELENGTIELTNKAQNVNRYFRDINFQTNYFHMFRYGGITIDDPPYSMFANSVENTLKSMNCVNNEKAPKSFLEFSNCMNPDSIIVSLQPLWSSRIYYYNESSSETKLTPSDGNEFESIWYLLLDLIYDKFFHPIFLTVINSIYQTLIMMVTFQQLFVVIFVVFGLIAVIAVIIQFSAINKHLKNVLKLLLHVPNSVVLHTTRIMEVLDGNFSKSKMENKTRDIEFFHKVVQNFPDAVLVVNSDHKIEIINFAVSRLLGVDNKNDVVGKTVNEFFGNSRFSGDLSKILSSGPNTNNNDKEKDHKNGNNNGYNNDAKNNNGNNNNIYNNNNYNNNNNNNIRNSMDNKGGIEGNINRNNNNNYNNNNYNSNYNNNNNNKNANSFQNNNTNVINYQKTEENGVISTITLESDVLFVSGRKVIILSDMTQTVRYNTLINEEKSKSDYLLSAILPPSLVKRVQDGQKNISFAVQSATIVFMDIVSFTPWCGSLPADKVMMTLNLLFKKFDANCNNYHTMTKIKCIGDCYMAAGGVFVEVNQPAEHAREVVCFGLDSMNSVLNLNKELDEKLQIRVGVNTGGPLVAGVLGIGKPTFEILGPAINMAQQMEHHGVPMQVHVSRSVYELIYGGNFSIKERGSIEVKGGSVITYLVNEVEDKK